jgi:hypothetical protein
MSRKFGSLNNLEVRGLVQTSIGIAVNVQFSAVCTECSLAEDFYSAVFRFRPFYKPRRPLGRVEV